MGIDRKPNGFNSIPISINLIILLTRKTELLPPP